MLLKNAELYYIHTFYPENHSIYPVQKNLAQRKTFSLFMFRILHVAAACVCPCMQGYKHAGVRPLCYLNCDSLGASSNAATVGHDFGAHAMGVDAEAGAGLVHVGEGGALQGDVCTCERHQRAPLERDACEDGGAARPIAHYLPPCTAQFVEQTATLTSHRGMLSALYNPGGILPSDIQKIVPTSLKYFYLRGPRCRSLHCCSWFTRPPRLSCLNYR